MRSSEDNADDEFVFVANKAMTARGFNNVMLASSSLSGSPRPHPRLNHLQPIPTTLDFMPSPVPRTLTNASNTTTSKSKATPLPPELIELLPPHLRENTVPDYTASSSSSISLTSSPFNKTSGEEEVPERPPLPSAYCPGDYSNLEEPTTAPTTAVTSSSPHNYAYLSDIITSDALSVLTATHTHGTRASSLTASRPSSRNGSTNTHTASYTAPAALGLTDSGISSGGSSSSNSSSSSRSNSSRSLPREGSRTSLNGRPLQPPSPKFARSALANSSLSNNYNVGNNASSSSPAPPSLTKVSYTAVLASDGERASMYRKLEALTPTPSSPLLNNFRANSNPQATTRADLSSAAVEGRPHTRHVATAHTTLTAMGQCKSSVSHTSTPSHTPSSTTPTPNQTPNHTPTPGRKSKPLLNGVSSTAGVDVHHHPKCRNGRVGEGGGVVASPSPVVICHQLPTSVSSSSRHASPIRNTPIVSPSGTTYTSSSGVHSSSSMGQRSDRQARGWVVTPPSSPEMRRAWNVVGVPVSHSISTPTTGRSPAASPIPRPGYSVLSGSDPDSIYDNLVVRHPPLAAPAPKSAPMASVPPNFTPVAHSVPSSHQYQRMTQSPVASGKPPSPITQRRAASRSPTPTGAWVASPGGGVGVVSPHYVPYYPSQDGQYGGCWVPVWGSSPQLYQGDGTIVYPAYVYGGAPGAPPQASVMCEGRSHSCDRMQSRPSPPPSPRNGRRSASPWRGGSASPVSHRHSPSPDPPGSGRPPRPRRPPMRKSKTVEVGFLGVGNQPPSSPPSAGEGVASGNSSHPSLHSGSYMQGPISQAPGPNHGLLRHLGHPSPSAYQRYYVNQKQQRVPNFEVIHEQMRNNVSESPYVNCPSSSSSSYSPHMTNGSSHDLTSPSLVTSTCYASPETVNSSLSARQGQAEVTKQKSQHGDRVCGGSGLRSPAHPATAATPTPLMPRLLTTPGLSGSASRLSGGSEGGGPNTAYGGGGVGGLASTRLGGSYTALVSSAASSGYGSCAGGAAVVSSSRHEDSEDLSDVSSGATSEDSARRRRRRSAQPMKGEASVSGNEDFEWVRASPMLTGLLEGHVTRLATPPDHRGHSLRASLATPPESGEEGTGIPAHRHRQYPRPPPVPRPRTLEAGDLIPHRPIRDNLRDGLRDRDRLYSPSRDLIGHRRSRDSSVERSGRDSSCERGSVSSLHQHNHHHHHLTSRVPQHTCECPTCWCDDEEGGYDSCDERHHHHRHSYHEGLHHAHLHQLQQSHHHGQSGPREASRERRSRGQGSGDSGRSSPCYCRHCHHLGSLSSLSSHDYCANSRLALPCTSKGSSLEDRVNRLEGDKDSLQLQVTVLSEQVEAQTEKIQDMESLLDQKKELLRKTEEQLQKEVMTRSSLETQRLELFSEISNMKLRQAAYERENVELRDKIRRSDHHSDHPKAQLPIQMANSPSPSTISTLSTIPSSSPKISPAQPITVSPTASPIPVASHDAREFLPPRTPPPNARRKIEQFGTIPRQRETDMGGASTTGRTKGVMFGKGLHFLPFRVAGKRSTSAPNLAETEMQMIDDMPEGEYCPNADGITPPPSSSPRMNTLAGHRSPTTQHKATGIKKIFTRLRRSSSGHLESDLGDGDFRRGGIRATASARLGWTSPNSAFKEPSGGFRSWNIETVEAWLGALGLSQYCAAVRSWSGAGRHMSQATPQQLDRDLGIRHPLHRKKLQLAISARLTGDQLSTPLARLDHAWVLRWLDDVGLPQYKDAFSEARIDGRVLNCLTYDDLAFLRLTNLLHVTSLKRGIQVLREHNFDPSVLKRRSVPEEDQRGRSASEVALWTNHRVMEWLRTVDLSEYAPNLRGSGVHGALMVYEVRFTSELLASLLSIPCGKTLLRRHLNTHFKELVGSSVVQEKRELEATTGYIPLTTSAKVKMPKKSQFSLKRKKTKSDLEFDDLLCPLDEKPPYGAIQDKEKEVRTWEVEEEVTDSVKVEEEKSISTDKETETNGDGRLC